MGGPLSKGDYRGQFEAEGYAVLRGVFTAGEVAEMAAAFDRIQARALAGGRSWRDRNTFFLLGDDEKLGRVLRFAQWPAWIDPVLERVRRDKSEEHTSELKSLMRISYAVFCLKK